MKLIIQKNKSGDWYWHIKSKGRLIATMGEGNKKLIHVIQMASKLFRANPRIKGQPVPHGISIPSKTRRKPSSDSKASGGGRVQRSGHLIDWRWFPGLGYFQCRRDNAGRNKGWGKMQISSKAEGKSGRLSRKVAR